MKVVIDSTRCQGHSQCIAIAPSLFELGSDGLAHLRRAPESGAEQVAAEDAEVMCPEQAIHCIREPDGAGQLG